MESARAPGGFWGRGPAHSLSCSGGARTEVGALWLATRRWVRCPAIPAASLPSPISQISCSTQNASPRQPTSPTAGPQRGYRRWSAGSRSGPGS